jgi:hypothetical protein
VLIGQGQHPTDAQSQDRGTQGAIQGGRKEVMSESKFTPGPWAAIEIEEGLFHVHSPKGERHNPVPVAVLDHHRDGHEATRTVTTPANAHLIAAAPEMYEALQRLMPHPLTGNPSEKTLREFWEYEKSQGRGEAEDVLFAMDAIAKAEGRQ